MVVQIGKGEIYRWVEQELEAVGWIVVELNG